MDVESDYQKERAERLRAERRYSIAKMVYRDLVFLDDKNRRPEDRERPTDYPALATEAVEAVDALLQALSAPDTTSPIPPFPEYEP